MTSGKQTYTRLRELFGRRGISPRRRYGQNFLIDLNLHDLIVQAAELTGSDVVLEVGPGAGALTERLAERAGAVVAVEIDAALAELARETVAARPNVRVLHADALSGKHDVNPLVVDRLRSALAVPGQEHLKLVANLPYCIATPLITNLLVHPSLHFSLMAVTIQRELAERLSAGPGTSAYGALSVLTQALADVELLRVLPPSVFWPRPKVDSAVVRIVPRPEKRAAVRVLPWFHEVVRRAFQHRRKHLRGVISSGWGDRLSKPDVDELMAALGLDARLRPVALNVTEWIELAETLRTRLRAVDGGN